MLIGSSSPLSYHGVPTTLSTRCSNNLPLSSRRRSGFGLSNYEPLLYSETLLKFTLTQDSGWVSPYEPLLYSEMLLKFTLTQPLEFERSNGELKSTPGHRSFSRYAQR